MTHPLDGLVPAAVGPFVACLARPDGTTEVVSGASAIQALIGLLHACLDPVAGRRDE